MGAANDGFGAGDDARRDASPLAISSQVLPRRPDPNLQNACSYGRPVSRRVAYFRSMLGDLRGQGGPVDRSDATRWRSSTERQRRTFGEAIHHLDAGGIALALLELM
jgi:hypothetical protein